MDSIHAVLRYPASFEIKEYMNGRRLLAVLYENKYEGFLRDAACYDTFDAGS